MLAVIYFFLPGLITAVLTQRFYRKNSLKWVKLLMISEGYNLGIAVLSYPINRILYGQEIFDIEFKTVPTWSYNKIAYGISVYAIALGVAAIVFLIKNKESLAWVLFFALSGMLLLGTPIVLTLYQQEMQKKIVINEVCSNNFSILTDAGGYYSDYIELYNPAYVEVELRNICISDSHKALDRFKFEDEIIPARGFYIVYASGDHLYDRMTEEMQNRWQEECHAPFKISSKGEEIFLSILDGIVIDKVQVPSLSYNMSYSRKYDGAIEFEIAKATPAETNLYDEEEIKYDYISDELPSIFIEGDLNQISKDINAHALVRYASSKQNFECFAKMQIQGGWTANLNSKNNYNIKLYSDSDMNYEQEVCFNNNWGEQYRYCLKANILDNTQAKNIVTSRIWNDMVRCRDNVDSHLLNAPNGGGTDGFPILVYINGEYEGLYTMNIPKSTWMFAMGNGEREAIWATKTHALSAGFGEKIDFDTELEKDWDLKYCSTEDDTWAKDSINRLIDFVINNDGTAFRDGIENYLDINAAIDYLILLYLSGAGDNMEKNICWITYDGNIWIPSMYDLDHTWELYTTPLIPQIVNNKVESNAGMLLWQRIVDNYPIEISNRYFELRENFLTSDYIQSEFENFMNQIPIDVYDLEYQTREENTPENSQEAYRLIVDYVDDRFTIFDNFYAELLEINEGK